MPKKEHYHVSAIGAACYVPSVIVKDETEALIELNKMVAFIRDVTGSFVVVNGTYEIKLSDGTIVRYKKCTGVCLPE